MMVKTIITNISYTYNLMIPMTVITQFFPLNRVEDKVIGNYNTTIDNDLSSALADYKFLVTNQ